MHYVFQEASITFFKKPIQTLSNYATKNQPGFFFFFFLEKRKRIFCSVIKLTNFANFFWKNSTTFQKQKFGGGGGGKKKALIEIWLGSTSFNVS